MYYRRVLRHILYSIRLFTATSEIYREVVIQHKVGYEEQFQGAERGAEKRREEGIYAV